MEELNQPHTPDKVRAWMAQSHPWLEVVRPTLPTDPALMDLDKGEVQAISLALEYRADLLLMDERAGTVAARQRGLSVVGTLGILDRAAELRWVDLPTMFMRLRQTTFRTPTRLIATLLEQDTSRRKIG